MTVDLTDVSPSRSRGFYNSGGDRRLWSCAQVAYKCPDLAARLSDQRRRVPRLDRSMRRRQAACVSAAQAGADADGG